MNWNAIGIPVAVNPHGRVMVGLPVMSNETQQGPQHPGILAEACDLRGGKRRDTRCRHQQQVDVLELCGDASAEGRPTEYDLLIFEAGQTPAQLDQAG